MPWLARDVGFELISSGGGSAFNAGGLALILLVALLWFVVAASVAIKGETMDRPNRIAQLYGFTVCLVSIIVALMTTSSLLNAAIDRVQLRRLADFVRSLRGHAPAGACNAARAGRGQPRHFV